MAIQSGFKHFFERVSQARNVHDGTAASSSSVRFADAPVGTKTELLLSGRSTSVAFSQTLNRTRLLGRRYCFCLEAAAPIGSRSASTSRSLSRVRPSGSPDT